MPTTTNFGWTTPADTDLVKDGASAIRTLGNGVDTSLVKLKGGTTGQVLSKASNSDMDFTWIAASSGKVKQVVQAEYSTSTTIASTTFTDTGLSASITPTASNSKVLVIVSQPAVIGYASGSSVGASAQIVRGSTAVFVQSANKDSLYFTIQVSGQSDLQLGQNISMLYLDSPATTSATTYKTQAAVSSTLNSRSITPQYNSGKSTITLIEIGA